MPLYEDIQLALAVHDIRAGRLAASYQHDLVAGLGVLVNDLILAFKIADPSEPKGLSARQDRLKIYLTDYVKPLLTRFYIGRRTEMPRAGAFGVMGEDFRSSQLILREMLTELAQLELSTVPGLINGAVGAELLTRKPTVSEVRRAVRALLLLGVRVPEWSRTGAFRLGAEISSELNQGILASEGAPRLRNRLRGAVKRRALTMAGVVRTGLNTVQNRVRADLYRANPDVLRGVWHSTVFDGKTSLICVSRGSVPNMYRLPDYARIPPTQQPYGSGPPYHPGCRSTMLPLFRRRRDLINSAGSSKHDRIIGLDADFDSVPLDLGLDALVRQEGGARLRAALGPRRFELWEKGRLPLANLIDQNSRPLRLDEL